MKFFCIYAKYHYLDLFSSKNEWLIQYYILGNSVKN